MLGALLVWGLRPGPLLFEKNPELVWGLIASMYIRNLVLLVLNLPLVGPWVQLLRVPPRTLLPRVLSRASLTAPSRPASAAFPH
jgi:putative tricarboxylic transport membrane protein